MIESMFYILLIEVIQESKEAIEEQIQQLKRRVKLYDGAIGALRCSSENAKGRERHRELLEDEELQDYMDGVSPSNDWEWRLRINRDKRIYSLAEDYWNGEIYRDDLAKKVDIWNRRKCEEQQRIEISHVLWEIERSYKRYSFPIR